MNGPVDFGRQLQAVDRLISSPPSWDDLLKEFTPAAVPDTFDPGDDMKKLLAGLYNTAEGRRIIEWLADLTFRAPYPHTGASLEAAALAAAKHEARAAVGRSILKAIADGNQLLNHRSQP